MQCKRRRRKKENFNLETQFGLSFRDSYGQTIFPPCTIRSVIQHYIVVSYIGASSPNFLNYMHKSAVFTSSTFIILLDTFLSFTRTKRYPAPRDDIQRGFSNSSQLLKRLKSISSDRETYPLVHFERSSKPGEKRIIIALINVEIFTKAGSYNSLS